MHMHSTDAALFRTITAVIKIRKISFKDWQCQINIVKKCNTGELNNKLAGYYLTLLVEEYIYE